MTVAEANGTLAKNLRSIRDPGGGTETQEGCQRDRRCGCDRKDHRAAPTQRRRLDQDEHQSAQGADRQHLPTGSMSRMVTDLLSGTNIAVSRIAAAQIGILIQNTERQPMKSINGPPTIGPGHQIPPPRPQMPSARARFPGRRTPANDRQRDRVHHRTADTLDQPGCDERSDAGARLQQRPDPEDRQTQLENPPTGRTCPGRTAQQQQRGQHQRVNVDDHWN